VSYQGHHKHSFYLISHAGLRGFTTDQVAVMANVARYYRKAAPSDEDDNFAQLSDSQKDVVRKLSAILRVADALDRGRRRAVRDVGVETQDGAVLFHVRLRGEGDVEVAAAMKRAKYFGKVFETDVDIEESSSAAA
jgi:exopolyphosphatase/guanosine-5'-triphosphate,3'-diphosphate pyrophosphatase